MKTRLFVAVAVAGFVQISPAQTPAFKDVLSVPYATGPLISPDGKSIAYSVTTADWKEDTYRRQLWVYDIATGQRTQLTRGGGVFGFDWAADGHRIAFSAAREGAPQIFLIDTRGGEAAKLTNIKEGVGSFSFSPDGTRMVYTTTPPEESRTKRKDSLGDFEVIESDEVRARIGILKVPAGLPDQPLEGKLLTDKAPFDVSDVVWSPDSRSIAVVGAPGAALRHVLEASLYVIDADTGKYRKLVGPGAIGNPIWSPDSATLAFRSAPDLTAAFHKNAQSFTVPSAGGEPKLIPMKLDQDVGLGKWTGAGILCSSQVRTISKLFRMDPRTGDVAELTPNDGWGRSDWSFSKDGDHCAYMSSAEKRWAEVETSSTDAISDHHVTEAPAPNLFPDPPSRTVVRWRSKDGAEIEGVLIKPANFDPKKKYPLLVEIHGGPTGTSEPFEGRPYAYPLDQWVARGAIVLQPNYRGSEGYGEKFRSLNVRNLGIGDEWDVLSGVDYLAKQGFVDESKMGCMGWSEGGYISAFITTTSDRFKAISVGAGISDWATYYYLTDITDFTRQYLKATPWADPEIYRKTSPITYVKNAKTPTLIQQGSNDQRVPVPNGYELFRALQDLHVPSKFILYTGFGHGVSKPREQLALLQHNWEWFGHYVWGDPLP